jgi:mono/diheme cytochrome c family protein
MKRITYISALVTSCILIATGCSNKRKPGHIYMPDMAYSRAYEAYAARDTNAFTMNPADRGGKQIYYDARPVEGTVRRGDLTERYELPNDSTGYRMSAAVKNPFDSISPAEMAEAQRLFNINCAICHGEKATANGPLATAGHIGGVANLTLPIYVDMADGTMFHSITYGKNNMGSYASQLTRDQRWMVIKYVRTLQPKAAPAATAGASPATAAKDTTAKTGK